MLESDPDCPAKPTLQSFLWFPVGLGMGISAYFSLSFEPNSFWVYTTCLSLGCLFTYGMKWSYASAGFLSIVLGFGLAKLRV